MALYKCVCGTCGKKHTFDLDFELQEGQRILKEGPCGHAGHKVVMRMSETYVPLKTTMHVDFDPDCAKCSAIATEMEDHYDAVHRDSNPDGSPRRPEG